MILKGQNFRILTVDSSGKGTVVGMATNCTVTLNSNADDASHKDITSMAALPTITSRGWSVSVESLNVTDVAAMLTAIKNLTPFTLRWDETSTTNNQTEMGRDFGREGLAYLNDATFTFNDRENATKSLQFTGSGPLSEISSSVTTDVISVSNTLTKGQFVRLFLSGENTGTPSEVIAAAKQLSLHVSMSLETSTTKDTEGDWDIQEPTALSYDITTSALVQGNDTITSTVMSQTLNDIVSIYENSSPVKFQIANVSGANQRTKGTVIVSGSVIISQLSIHAQNRQNATYDATLTGYGDYTVGA